MGKKTGISWTDSTWNPVTGCSKVSRGCTHCYAETWAKRHMGEFAKDHNRQFSDVICHEDKLNVPKKWKDGRLIFVNSMSDLFHEKVQDGFIDKVFASMYECRQHIFQVLTKRPERMLEYLDGLTTNRRIAHLCNHAVGESLESTWSEYPLHSVWLGVTVENQNEVLNRIHLLLNSPAILRFISVEPMLTPITLKHISIDKMGFYQYNAMNGRNTDMGRPCPDVPKLDWVICGEESGNMYDCRIMLLDWARALRDECLNHGIPFFMKQICKKGRPIPFEDFPEDLQIRQFPVIGNEQISKRILGVPPLPLGTLRTRGTGKLKK